MYRIHHLLLQRPSTNDLFLLLWHELGAQDLNFDDHVFVQHPPIPTTISFGSTNHPGTANGHFNFNTSTANSFDVTVYTYNTATWALVPSAAVVLNSTAISTAVTDAISVIKISPHKSVSTRTPGALYLFTCVICSTSLFFLF